MSRLGYLSPEQNGVDTVPQPLLLLHPSTRVPGKPDKAPEKQGTFERIGEVLTRLNLVKEADVSRALAFQKVSHERLGEILVRETGLSDEGLEHALHVQDGATPVDLVKDCPDPDLVGKVGAAECLARDVLPWKRLGSATLIAVSDPQTYHRHLEWLQDHFGRTRMVLATRNDQHRVIARFHGAELARQAEARPVDEMSCRSLQTTAKGVVIGPLLALGGIAVIGWAVEVYLVISLVALLALGLSIGLRALATLASMRTRLRSTDPKFFKTVRSSDEDAQLPVISVLVPLFKEQRIANRLIERLGKLDYPKSKLDICLVVEADDWVTRHTLARSGLPPFMRSVSVPHRPLRTKPRAMNYALDFCRGSIVGIYDAEDAPEPDQLRKVVRQFRQSGQSVACLQGRLQYYNTEQNLLSRCFSIDYALWFRTVLPGLKRLGFLIPLGGTTVFFRRQALIQIGAWDAHNVTEDADLGVRLARHGYSVELLDSATSEEATAGVWPWIRQRSRWIKGYAITYLVHMRAPVKLFRDLGAWRFFGFQALFFGSLASVFLAPVLWTFWLVLLGTPHPLDQILSRGTLIAIGGALLTAELLTILIHAFAIRHRPLRSLWPFVPVMHFYGMMVSLAGIKALAELVVRPFFWDKTSHGAWKADAT